MSCARLGWLGSSAARLGFARAGLRHGRSGAVDCGSAIDWPHWQRERQRPAERWVARGAWRGCLLLQLREACRAGAGRAWLSGRASNVSSPSCSAGASVSHMPCPSLGQVTMAQKPFLFRRVSTSTSAVASVMSRCAAATASRARVAATLTYSSETRVPGRNHQKAHSRQIKRQKTSKTATRRKTQHVCWQRTLQARLWG